MMQLVNRLGQWRSARSTSLAIGLIALSIPVSLAAPGDLNSINDRQNIQGGTYFNTPGSRTTFQNSSGGGLFLQSGDLVRGLESNASKTPTGNGGTLYFRAPGNMVRFDGDIDVSAVRNGTLYTGNGGKVFVDSAYLFQNGNIFANGANGGLVQLNVGGLTMGANAKITAQGFGGDGGTVSIHSPGTVDIRAGALIDTSGKVIGTFDTNVINIEGSLVNNQGILRANGVAGTDFKPSNGDGAVMAANPQLANNPVPGPITAGNGTNDTATMRNVLFETPGSADFRGGTIRLVAAGQNNATDGVVTATNGQILSASEKSELNARNAQLADANDGNVLNGGQIIADGALSKNGGTVLIASAKNVVNNGTIRANGSDRVDGIFDANGNGAKGGDGGTISINAQLGIANNALIQADGGRGSIAQSRSVSTANGQNATATVTGQGGAGGDGGVIAFSYGNGAMFNGGRIQANGGLGGFGGHANSFDSESAAGGSPQANATSNSGNGASGGRGGLIAFSGNGSPKGAGNILANGGQGGRSGNAWADSQARTTGMGLPKATSTANVGAGGSGGAAGTIITPEPGVFSNTFSTKAGGQGGTGSAGFREVETVMGLNNVNQGSTPGTNGSALSGGNRALLATRKNEYIRHEETALLLTQGGGDGTASDTFSGRLNDALIRTVGNPVGVSGASGAALSDAESASNLVVSGTNPQNLTFDLSNSNINPLFFNLNTLTVLNNGNLTNNTLWTPGVHLVGEGFHDLELALGGGHISWLANGDITNNQIVITRGLWSGGTTQVAATRDIVNNGDFINIAPNKALLSGFSVSGPVYESSHAGSLIFKAGRDINNTATGKLESNLIFFDIHPPLNQNPPIAWPRFLNGAQMGATTTLLAGRNFNNAGLIRADALTYRNGQAGADNPALTIGGIVTIRAKTGTFTNTGTISALGNAFFSPNESDGPRFNNNTFPAVTSFNGTVSTP